MSSITGRRSRAAANSSGWRWGRPGRTLSAWRGRRKDFWRYRVAKFVRYFERVLNRNGGRFTIGRSLTYVDLSLFQIVEGLRYAFPKRMKRFERKIPSLIALHDRIAKRPRIASYLASPRRLPFSPCGIYRYLPAL